MQIKKFLTSFSIVCLVSQSLVHAQPSARMLRYDVKAEINDRRSEMKAEARVWVQLLRDSVDRIVFTFPENFDFDAARDSTGKKYERKKISSPRGKKFQDIAFLLPDTLHVRDSVFIAMTYEEELDTASTAEIFVNEREILLQADASSSWVPLLSSSMNALQNDTITSHIDLTLSSAWRVFANGAVDTLHKEDEKISFRIHNDTPTRIDAALLVYASKQAVTKKYYSPDSAFSVSIVSDTIRFQPEFRAALGALMNSSQQYFSALFPFLQKNKTIQFIFAGSDDGSHHHKRCAANIIVRSTPQFAYFDSTVFRSSLLASWVQDVASGVLPSDNDSLAWFRKGLTEYLAARFYFDSVLTTHEQQQQERSMMMAKTLDFYSLPSSLELYAARTLEDRITQKLRYVFLMLEYVMSRDMFDSALRNCIKRANVPFSPYTFQQECEQVYGSSLGWFFQEWIAQTSFPEFLCTWQSSTSKRGETSVSVSVSQRGNIFTMPLDILFTFENKTIVKRVFVENQNQNFLFSFSTKPINAHLDPNYAALRWIPELRIRAHARTALLFLSINRDSSAAAQEALLTLQLDPDNVSGSNGLALYALGKISALKKDYAQAEEYFRTAANVLYIKEFSALALFSKVRLGNVLELEDKRSEALALYNEVLHEAHQNILDYADVEFDVQKYIRNKNEVNDSVWWEK